MTKYILRFPKYRAYLKSLLLKLRPLLPSNGRFAALDKPDAYTNTSKAFNFSCKLTASRRVNNHIPVDQKLV